MGTKETTLSLVNPESIGGGEDPAVPGVAASVGALLGAFGQGQVVVREAVQFGKECLKIAVGRSAVTAPRGDRRFTDPAWTTNPIYHRVQQAYLTSTEAVDGVVEQWGSTVDDQRAQRAAFAANIVTSALAPTNFLPTNPAAIKEAFDTAGISLVRGLGNYLSDLRRNGGMPSMVDPDAFTVGVDLAVTPGAVITRDGVGELLHYTPTTETVYERPVLVVPPPIGRFYFLDLRPGRSFVEYSVSQGLSTFLLSWRNPQPEQGHWDLDTYARTVSSAIDEICAVTGCEDVNVIGFCAGGIIMTTLLNHMTAHGDKRVHSNVLRCDNARFRERGATSGVLGIAHPPVREEPLPAQGCHQRPRMGSAFTWMRPNDLVFNYVVNNYLMGRTPPAFDVLAWNADGTNLPAALHGQFLDIFADNLLARTGSMSVLGTPIDLAEIEIPTFVSGAIADHLTAWKSCYRTTQLLGGDSTFVLSYSGHIASLVNPPGNPGAYYWEGGTPGADPDEWLNHATKKQGTWWESWARWVTERAGERLPTSRAFTPNGREPLGKAPGLYVLDAVEDIPQ
ncbi:PHA/PHB synthase family protein [Rhodococcus opacus]|uniref:PHA/PHB synthase family protein n=1 Tax=Rhodococcus opacus TaxID=37919 RepID=UPI001F542374|nr:alpha/beta fold hydrolase [Rhodococcus opacus]